jgi:hypothetical protein
LQGFFNNNSSIHFDSSCTNFLETMLSKYRTELNEVLRFAIAENQATNFTKTRAVILLAGSYSTLSNFRSSCKLHQRGQ